MTDQLLFPLPEPTGHRKSKAKPADVIINRVNRQIAKRRYYLHRRLGAEFKLNKVTREIKAPYNSFDEIPQGQRWYIGQFLALGYKIQYEIF